MGSSAKFGKRGARTAVLMDRSASFRDNMENPILSSLPSMSRSTVNVSQEDVTSFLQCLRFDLKSMAAEYKCNRFGDFKQLANAALCAPDESPSGLFKSKLPFYSPEDLKRLKVGLRESTIKARERVKVFSDVLSVINKCFPSIPSRKRSRPDAFSGTQTFEQKVEERGKNVIPNKRTRTSMVDQRGLDGTLPMKKKRTVIKADWPPSTSSVLVKPMQSRGLADSRSRLNDEYRSGAANGSMRSSIPRPEQDNTSVLHDKRDQATTNVRPLNKVNVRQDFISGTPSSTTKPQAVARGPRSGPSGVPKLTHSQPTTLSNGSNPGLITSTNRKRGPSTRSPSPPVAQWADRRPQKISRTARRTNLTPLLSTNGELPPLNNGDISENGRGFTKRFPANSPKQFKSKGDHNNVTLSESEDSGAAEIRSFGKSEEFVDKDRINGQKKSTLVGPARKNKFLNAKHHRTTRGLASVQSDKQLRNGRLGFDKPESKIGRPATRKLSGRQTYTRQKHSEFSATDFFDDGHSELLAAANAVMNPAYAFSSPFWKQMDPHFGFVSDSSVTYLKQERNVGPTAHITNPNCITNNGTESGCEYLTSGTSPRGVTLCQRLLSALISEEDNNDELNYNVYESAFESEISGSFSSDSRYQYGGMSSMDERLLIEIRSLGLYPEHVPDLVHTGDDDISKDISKLEEKHYHQVFKKKSLLDKVLKSTEKAIALQEKEFEQLSLEKLTRISYQKYMSYSKSTSSKMAKQSALDFVKRTLNRCHEFETTGKSCFNEPLFKEIFHSGLSDQNHTEEDDVIGGQQLRKVNGTFMQDFSGTQVNPMLTMLTNQDIGKDDVWSSRGKNRELYLGDVSADVACTSSGVERVNINSAKGKRSERDPRNGGAKVGRPAKVKAKQKQKTTVSANGSPGSFSDQQRAKSSFAQNPTANEEDESMLLENFEEPLDLSHLQLPEMVDFGGQGEDIGSWLNIDDDVLHDDGDDFMGLEIPMDDLTDLNMMV